jgi:DNA polymerase-3 subunit chi
MTDRPEKIAEFLELRSPEGQLLLACTVTAREYERGRTVSVYAPDPKQAEELDSLLWTFEQNSFVAHVRLEQAQAPPIEPVLIFSGEPGDLESDVLVLISAEQMPGWFERHGRIYDFAAVYDERLKQASRQRYAACQAAGYRMRFIRP